MPIPVTNPFVIARTYFVSKGCSQFKMDDAKYAPIPEADDIPGWKGVVRDRAREEAINWMWGVVPRCIKIGEIQRLMNEYTIVLNPYVRPEERAEFAQEFRIEVMCRLEMMIATGRS